MRLALVTRRKEGAILIISILEGFNQRWLMNEGVKFPGGEFTKHLLRQIARKLRRKVWYPICVNPKREGHHE